jgi:excisionase family DNA binding protein
MRPKGISVDRYRELAAQGLTASEAARALGVRSSTVQDMAKRHGIVFVKGSSGRPKQECDE